MKFIKVSLVCSLFSLAIVASTNAIPTPVNITVSGGTDVIAAPKSDLGDFGDPTVLSWLTTDVVNYNTINSTTYPAPVTVTGQIGQTSGAGGNNITLDLTGTYDYLFFHWGGQNGGWAQAFYIGGLTGDFSFDNSLIGTGQGPSVGGLSFFSYYGPGPVPTQNNAPDGGVTAAMLGMALTGFGLVARRIKK